MKKFLIFLLIFIQTVSVLAKEAESMPDCILAAQKEGIIFGDEKGNLHLEEEATRAEFLTFLVRFLGLSGGENVFSDISENDWFASCVAAANFSGIFLGFSDGTARPYERIKTEDAIAILGRYYNAASHKGSYSGISDYAVDYFGYAFENGIFAEWKHLPAPKSGITREEIISILYRYRKENVQNLCFESNYPKLSEWQVFGKLSVDIKTAEDCEIYYAIQKKGHKGYNWEEVSKNQLRGKEESIHISADINSTYDLYVKAVSKESGRTQIKEIQNVAPLSFTRGHGTHDRPYVIYTELQLSQISNFPDKAYMLGTDVNISGKWTPICNFSGSLDGDGYRITGISVNESGQNAGLFAEIKGGMVKNLTVDASIKAKSAAGIIAGVNDGGIIEGCCAIGTAEVSGNNCGGICGINHGEIKGCLSCAYTVRAGSFAGGISGQNSGNITECLSCAETVTSDMYAGGISGQNNGGSISNCAAANIAVYNTMTYNGGKISTNRNDGEMRNNFSLSEMVSNAARTDANADSRNGLEVPWESFENPEFYIEAGWDMRNWKQAERGFLLICPKNAAEPIMESGKTPYFPKQISTADELISIRKNPEGHYLLAKDIVLKTPRKTIDVKDGFSGTLDGNGYTIYDLVLKGEIGLFSNITGGTVKNLNISGVKASNLGGAVIAACNYGYIENCSVSGEIQSQRVRQTAGIAGENNGRIENCIADIDFVCEGNVKTGGICAINNGVINRSKFSGKMQIAGENSVAGGICGTDNEGYISECFSHADATLNGLKSYFGGICALSEGSQIYKCASTGTCRINGEEIYVGGICAVLNDAVVYDCFSQQKLASDGKTSVSGGICGEAQGSNIQNTYYTGEIRATGENAVSGGICAKARGSFIMQNVTLSPVILGKNAAGAIVAEFENCDVSDNYNCSRTLVNSRSFSGGERNGESKPVSELFNAEFYIKPLSEGGILGWEDSSWEASQTEYMFPILSNMPDMGILQNPVYK